MNLNTKIIFSIATFLITSTRCSEIIIRPATEEDFEAIFALSHDYYQNDFKQFWIRHYALLTPKEMLIIEFVKKKETNNNDAIETFVKLQAINNTNGLLVALKQESVVGYCRFKKIDTTTMYMNNILVKKSLRNKGIAKQLAFAAFNTWNTVTQCNFRAFIHDNLINQINKQHNCVLTNTASLTTNTGEIITKPNTSITHNEYSYMIQRRIKSK